MLSGLLASLLVTFFWIIACIVFMHCYPTAHRFRIMTKSFCCSLPLLWFFVFLLQHQPTIIERLNGHESPILAYFMALLMHFLFFFFVVECFYHIERSVTLRLLIEIQQHPSSLTISDLMKNYSVDDMIMRRLQDMAKNGWSYYENDRWKLTPKGHYLALLMHFSCWLFQSKPQNKRL